MTIIRNPNEVAIEYKADAPKLADGEIDVEQLALDKGWIIRYENLKTKKGQLRSVLLPMPIGGFVIQVDKRPSPTEKWEKFAKPEPEKLQQALVRFRVAQAIGHSLFYETRTNQTPIHISFENILSSVEEEKYCDRFAAALLAAPELATETYINGPTMVIAAAKQRHIPTYAWLLAADQYRPIRAIAGWARHNGEYLINKTAFSLGVDNGPMLWFTEPEIAKTLEVNIKASAVNPNIERHFLAFPKTEFTATSVVIEAM